MPFEGFCRLEFIDPQGDRHAPGDQVSMPDETPEQQHEIKKLLDMGVIQRSNPASNIGDDGQPEVLADTAADNRNPASRGASTGRPKGRAAQKLAEKEARER